MQYCNVRTCPTIVKIRLKSECLKIRQIQECDITNTFTYMHCLQFKVQHIVNICHVTNRQHYSKGTSGYHSTFKRQHDLEYLQLYTDIYSIFTMTTLFLNIQQK